MNIAELQTARWGTRVTDLTARIIAAEKGQKGPWKLTLRDQSGDMLCNWWNATGSYQPCDLEGVLVRIVSGMTRDDGAKVLSQEFNNETSTVINANGTALSLQPNGAAPAPAPALAPPQRPASTAAARAAEANKYTTTEWFRCVIGPAFYAAMQPVAEGGMGCTDQKAAMAAANAVGIGVQRGSLVNSFQPLWGLASTGFAAPAGEDGNWPTDQDEPPPF